MYEAEVHLLSILSDLRKALDADDRIVIVDEKEQVNIGGGEYKRGKDHVVDIILAPNRSSGVYDIPYLQELLNSLTAGHEPLEVSPFCIKEGRMELGVLFFEEKIGTVLTKIQIFISDEDLKNSLASCPMKERVMHRDMYRRIHVRLYPNLEIAKIALFEGGGMSRISLKEIEMYKRKR